MAKSLTPEQFKERLKTDWCWTAEHILGATLWEKQREIIKSVQSNRRTAVKASAMSSKTHTAGLLVHCFLLDAKARGETAYILTTAGSWDHVRTVLWREIRAHHKNSSRVSNNVFPDGVGGELLQVEFRLDEDRQAIGLSVDDPGNFRGHHAQRMLIIVDEASVPEQELFDVIETMMADENCRLLYISNPTSQSGAFFDAFHRNRNLFNCISISAFDTPNIKEGKKIIQGLATRQWVDDCRAQWTEDSPLWEAYILGEFPTMADDNVIALSLVERAINNIGLGGHRVVALDLARKGSDSCSLCVLDGHIFRPLDVWGGQELTTSFAKLKQAYLAAGGEAHVTPVVDDTGFGLGGGSYELLKDLIDISVVPFIAGAKARDEERYANVRTESWFLLRAALDEGILQLPDDERLKEELIAPKFKFVAKGKYQLESKDETKKRLGRSPDRADSVVMAWWVQKNAITADEVQYFNDANKALHSQTDSRRDTGPLVTGKLVW